MRKHSRLLPVALLLLVHLPLICEARNKNRRAIAGGGGAIRDVIKEIRQRWQEAAQDAVGSPASQPTDTGGSSNLVVDTRAAGDSAGGQPSFGQDGPLDGLAQDIISRAQATVDRVQQGSPQPAPSAPVPSPDAQEAPTSEGAPADYEYDEQQGEGEGDGGEQPPLRAAPEPEQPLPPAGSPVPASQDGGRFKVLVSINYTTDGSAPTCYNPRTGATSVWTEAEPRGSLPGANFPTEFPTLPQYDFCKKNPEGSQALEDAIFAGGSYAAHAAAALAFAEAHGCPGTGVTAYYLGALSPVPFSGGWNTEDDVSKTFLFYDNLVTAFDRAGMAMCSLVEKRYENKTVEYLGSSSTGLNMPSWFAKQDYRLQGGDLATGTAPSATECDYQCWDNSMCAAWTWVAATSACELKGAAGWTGAEEAGSTSGIAVWASADVFQINTTFEDGTAYVGGDLLPGASALPVASIDTCARACAWVEACGAWTFTAAKVCELKHASGWTTSEDPQAASGALSRPPAPPAATEAASVPSAPAPSGQEKPPALSPASSVPPSVAPAPASDTAPVPQDASAELQLAFAPAAQPPPAPLQSVAPGPSTAPEASPESSSPVLEQLPFPPSSTLEPSWVATPPKQPPLPAPEASLAASPLVEQPATMPTPGPNSSPEAGAATGSGQEASPAATGSKSFRIIALANVTTAGSPPICYNTDTKASERLRDAVPRGSLPSLTFPTDFPTLPSYDFCSETPLAFQEFKKAIFDGGAVAAHAAAALAYAENYACPNVGAMQYLLGLAAAGLSPSSSYSNADVSRSVDFYENLVAAFDRAGMAACVLLLKRYQDGTAEVLDTLSTGVNMPSLFVKAGYRLRGGDLSVGTAPSATECDYQCWESPSCAAWSWVAATSVCELKGALGWTGAEEAGATSGVSTWSSAGADQLFSTFVEGVAYVGGDLLPESTELAVGSQHACAESCFQVEACGAWTLTAAGLCQLKQRAGWAAVNDPTLAVASGILVRPKSSRGSGEQGSAGLMAGKSS